MMPTLPSTMIGLAEHASAVAWAAARICGPQSPEYCAARQLELALWLRARAQAEPATGTPPLP